ncbi:MAG: YihY/virulence factor BrkB family protein [Gemmatimonadaceae bacterium]
MTPIAFVRLLWQAFTGWLGDSASRHGAAIAYYTLFAMAPVLLVVIALAGLVFGQDAVSGQIAQQLGELIGRDGATAIQGILQRAREPREGVSATILGIAGLILATTGAFLEMQAALNRIWRVRPSSTALIDVRGLIRRRLRSLGMVVSIAFLLLVSLTVSAGVNAAVGWFGSQTPVWPTVVYLTNQLVSLLVTALLFGALLRVLPDVHLRWRDVAVGAVVTAVLFAIGQRVIGLYLGRSALASPFGAAGTIAIILVWVYYSAQIVLLGAEFTRVWAARTGRDPQPKAGAVLAPRSAE